MPPISSHQSATTTKLMLIGDSGSGKTGALASLAAAGYNLRILDLDNGLDVLKNYVTDPTSQYVKQAPNCAERIQYVTITDGMRNVNGRVFPAKVSVWDRTMRMLNEWKEPAVGDMPEINLGKVADWTAQEVLVLDSLSMLATGAHNFHLSMNAGLGQNRTQNEYRRDVGATQALITTFLELIYSDAIKCNVIVLAHITAINDYGGKPDQESKDEAAKSARGYPSAIGRALSPRIPRYFNNVLVAQTVGTGRGTRHRIYTQPTIVDGQIINAKSSAPLRVAPEYPLETGLADYFKAVRGQ